jgi:hypothetical protein
LPLQWQQQATLMTKNLRRTIVAFLLGSVAVAFPVLAATPDSRPVVVAEQSMAKLKEQKLIPSVSSGVHVTPVQLGKIHSSAMQVSLAGAQPEVVAVAAGAVGTTVTPGAVDEAAGATNIGTMILASLALMLWIAARRLGR